MNETVYIETSILGYLTARPTDNLILAANIKITQDWWDEYGSSLVLYVSEIVEDEASRGDSTIAAQRQNLLQSLIFLDLTEEAIALAQEFLQQSNLPPKASNDALHMANAQIQRKLSQISLELGYNLPFICTPYEFRGFQLRGE